MKTLSGAWLAAALGAAVLVAGCGGDDAEGQPSGNPDAAPDVVVIPQGDGGTPPPADGSTINPDGAGGCNFATFVKGLIANDTTASALPSTDLGQACTDNQNQAEFQSLFP